MKRCGVYSQEGIRQHTTHEAKQKLIYNLYTQWSVSSSIHYTQFCVKFKYNFFLFVACFVEVYMCVCMCVFRFGFFFLLAGRRSYVLSIFAEENNFGGWLINKDYVSGRRKSSVFIIHLRSIMWNVFRLWHTRYKFIT